eukprot:Pgem_evm1s12747
MATLKNRVTKKNKGENNLHSYEMTATKDTLPNISTLKLEDKDIEDVEYEKYDSSNLAIDITNAESSVYIGEDNDIVNLKTVNLRKVYKVKELENNERVA